MFLVPWNRNGAMELCSAVVSVKDNWGPEAAAYANQVKDDEMWQLSHLEVPQNMPLADHHQCCKLNHVSVKLIPRTSNTIHSVIVVTLKKNGSCQLDSALCLSWVRQSKTRLTLR